jgi:murein DD-endopeptidase MepM/ murein hydrolase activator NlpD
MYVEAGDVVSAGDTIAKVGNEGQSTGPHLHYEIHRGGMNGKPIDPQDWLADRGVSVG